MMITRRYLTHILEPNMTKTTDKPALWRRAASLVAIITIRLTWISTWLFVVLGALTLLGFTVRMISFAFNRGWTFFGHLS